MADLERTLTLASINKMKGGWTTPTERTFIARFRGQAVAFKMGTTQFGDYYKFLGSFLAWNREGTEFAGHSLIVPEPAQGIILGALMSRAEQNASVDFAFDMFIVPDDDPRNGRGYMFVTSTIFDDAGESYAAMRKGLPALPIRKAIK